MSTVVREFVVVGGGIAAVSAVEELVRLMVQAHKEEQQRQPQTSAAEPTARRQRVRRARQPESDGLAEGAATAAAVATSVPPAAAAVPSPASAVPPTRVTLLHADASLQHVAATTQHTELLEEVTAVASLAGDDFLQRLQAHLPPPPAPGMPQPVQVRLVQGLMLGLDVHKKQVLYEARAGMDGALGAAASAAAPLQLAYDRLCLCTGAQPAPFVTPGPGQQLPPQLLTIRDAASLARLSSMLAAPLPPSQHGKRAKRLAIVGNGGIAIELVHALHTGQLLSTGGGVNASDAVASPAPAGATAAASASGSSVPPLSVNWAVSHSFLCPPFLDPISSAFLMPELFPTADPPLPQTRMQPHGQQKHPAGEAASETSAQQASGEVDEMKDVAAADVTSADVSEEERIAGVQRGQHVRTVLCDCSGSAGAAPVVDAAAHAAQSPVSSAPSTAAALGPNWLNRLQADSNIPKYIVERERERTALEAARRAVAESVAKMGLGTAQSSDPPAPTLPPFDLSLDLCTEVSELHVLDESSPFPLALLLTSGKRIEVDLVVSATGVQANTAWAPPELRLASEGEGPHRSGGIVVDECLRSSVPDVYAAGDCACLRFSEAFLAQHVTPDRPLLFHQERLWSHAKLLGCYAARSLSGLYEAELSELGGFNFLLFAHTSVLFGRKAVLLGLHNLQNLGGAAGVRQLVQSGALRTLVRCRPERRAELIKLHLLHGRLIGALLLGKMDASGEGEGADALELEETCENLMLNQTDLGEFGDFLNDVDVDLADYFD